MHSNLPQLWGGGGEGDKTHADVFSVCQSMDSWLKVDARNVAVVHCKVGSTFSIDENEERNRQTDRDRDSQTSRQAD